jgi:parallel beta-helix repeat protein
MSKHSDSHINQVTSLNHIKTAKTLKVGLAAFLLSASSGLILLPAWANSQRLSQQIAQTPAPAAANIIYVNPQTGNDSAGAGNQAAPYRTITFALQQAQPGTVIQLAPGSYTAQSGEVFPLTVRRGVILRGDDSTRGQNIVILGGGQYLSPTFAGQDATIVAESDSEIRGVTVTNPNKRGTGVWVESSNPTIANSTFSDSKREGVFITGQANPKIENNLFTRNDANGISVARAARGEILRNQFQSTGFGIAIGGTSSPLIAENRILQNTDGIYINDSARPVLRNNLIQNNARAGIVVTVNGQPDLGTEAEPGNNVIRNNTNVDLQNATSSVTILAIGNDINRSRISGRVNFVAAQVTPPAGGTNAAFADIEGHWAKPYIEALATKGILTGYEDGTFRPSEPVNRAQFAVIIQKAFTPAPQRPSMNFADVRSNFWAFPAIQAAYRGGFLSGEGRNFRPEQQITRVQALVALATGLKLPNGNPSILAFYKDAAQIPSYAASAVAAATNQKMVVNYPEQTQLNPNQVVTRADAAAFVYQALVNSGRAEAIASPYVVTVSSNTPSEAGGQ